MMLLVLVSACNTKTTPTPTIIDRDTPSPTQTITLTKTLPTLSTSSKMPTITKTLWQPTRKPSPSSTITPTPLLLVDPPAGIWYQTDTGLFVTEGLGKSRKLFELSEGEFATFSPDNSYVLLFGAFNQYLINLKTGEKTTIWPRGGYNLCPFSWVNRTPLVLISVLLPEGSDPGYSCNMGSPVLLSLEGKITVFDKDEWGLSAPDVSWNGQTIAYDLGGKPWLYDWQDGSKPFDITSFGFPRKEKVFFSDPSWSPSDRKLAWTYRNYETWEDTTQQGIAIFDFDTKTSILLAPYYITDFEGSRPHILWNRDDTYLSFRHYQMKSQDFVWELISVDGNFSQTLEGDFGRWSPNSNLYSMRVYFKKDKIWKLYIKSLDGSVSHPICCGEESLWSPDGKQLLSFLYSNKEFWLTDIITCVTVKFNLPPGSEVIGWESDQ